MPISDDTAILITMDEELWYHFMYVRGLRIFKDVGYPKNLPHKFMRSSEDVVLFRLLHEHKKYQNCLKLKY